MQNNWPRWFRVTEGRCLPLTIARMEQLRKTARSKGSGYLASDNWSLGQKSVALKMMGITDAVNGLLLVQTG